jgi:hypothetical protein
LAQGETEDVVLAALTVTPTGAHTLKVHTTSPNGLTDAVPANDTATSNFTRSTPIALPVVQDFETALVPPGWSITNPDQLETWGWYTPGRTGPTDVATAIDNYNYEAHGQTDDINTALINTPGLLTTDSILVSFDLAHKNYPDANDVLQVLASGDCGATYTVVWERAGAALATAGSLNTWYNSPIPADWKRQSASIGNNIFGSGQILVKIRNVNDYGNVVWLDNIKIDLKPRIDLVANTVLRPNVTECAPPFAPSLTVRNAGGETVTGFKAGYILDNGAPVIQSYNISLAPGGGTTTITFPNITPATGTHTIKLFVGEVITANPGPDGTPANDTILRTFTVAPTVTNIVQGFESATFAPTNWFLINPNNNLTWVRTSPGKASNFSAVIDNASTNTTGQIDHLQAPPVRTTDADGVTISFDVAHKYYEEPGFVSADRLRVLVSTDCGATFTPVYSKSGPTLATAGGGDAEPFLNPTQDEWRRETIEVGAAFTGGNLIVRFENRSDWGNNIFLDNIAITPKFKRDLQVVSISPSAACTPDVAPVATITNAGTEAVTAYDIAYTVGTGTPVVQSVTGVNIAPGATTNVTLGTSTLAAGANTLKVYTSGTVTASGTGDQYRLNDTLSKVVYVTAPVQIVAETFESGAVLPPVGWALNNADGGLTWQRGPGKSSTGGATIRNYVNYSAGQRDELFTPVLEYTGADSIHLVFDLSATTRVLADGVTPMDTLEILVTKDCGATFTTVYKKWGAELQTLSDFNNYATATEFIPLAPSNWRREIIDLSSYRPNGTLQVVFRNTTNNQNNIYIDNVFMVARTLPANLKQAGYAIYPNPSDGQFNLWFVEAPTNLKFISVMNSSGQQVWKKEYTGNTSNVLPIDLTGKAAGMYIVNVGYNDGKDIQIRIMKY